MALLRAAFAQIGASFGTSTRESLQDARLANRFNALHAAIGAKPPHVRLFRA